MILNPHYLFCLNSYLNYYFLLYYCFHYYLHHSIVNCHSIYIFHNFFLNDVFYVTFSATLKYYAYLYYPYITIFDTDKLLNRPVRVAVSNTSGLAGIAHWISSNPKYYKLKGSDKNDPLVVAIKAWVDKAYADGRTTVICDEELDACIEDYFKEN